MASLFENMQSSFNEATATQPNMIWYIVIVILALTVLAIWYFRPKAEEVTVMGPYMLKGVSSEAHKSSLESIFDSGQLRTKLGNNFTLSAFIYMDDTNAERIPLAGPKGDFRFKPLLIIQGVGLLTVDPIHQMARVSVSPLASSAILKRDTTVNIDIENFVAARWNQITITVEGRTVDIYLNGALAKSALLENVPVLYPVGVLLETIPDFSGQIGLFQAWPRRLTEGEVAKNYKRNTDTRGKPLIPEKGFSINDALNSFGEQICKLGFCGFRFNVGPMQYIDYDFA